MLYDAEIMLAFIEEIAEYLPQMRQHLNKLAQNPRHKESLEEAYRLAHTIKGSAAMLELNAISAEGKELEQALLPITEKKATFQPALATSLISRVDKVERLLAEVKAEVNGEALPAAQAAPRPVAPPPPPIRSTPPPPMMPSWSASMPPTPSAAYMPPPPPPPPAFRSDPIKFDDFNLFDDFELDLPPSVPPQWLTSSESREALPPPPPSMYPFDLPALSEKEKRAGEKKEATPNFFTPPPLEFNYDLKSEERDFFAPVQFNLQPPPVPASLPPPIAPAVPDLPPVPVPPATPKAWQTAAVPAFPPAPLPSVEEEAAQEGIGELELMDFLLEPEELESLEQALFASEASFGPTDKAEQAQLDRLLAPEKLELDFDSFEPRLDEMAHPMPLPLEPTIDASHPSFARELQTDGLSEILATGAVDYEIDLLQSEILSELPVQMADFESVPLPSEIGVSDADLLQALGTDITASQIPNLPGLDSDNSRIEPPGVVVPALADLPVFEIPRESDNNEPLPDFKAAEDLLAAFDNDNSFDFATSDDDFAALAYLPPLPELASLNDDAVTIKPGMTFYLETPTDTPEAFIQSSESVQNGENLENTGVLPQPDAAQMETQAATSEEFAFYEFELLDDTLAAAKEDEEATQMAALATLRGLPNLDGATLAGAEAFATQASTKEEEDAAIVAILQKEAAELPDEFSEEQLAEAGFGEADDMMGAFFLGEAQADLDRLKELVADFDQPGSDKMAVAGQVSQLCSTLRKAAQMMDLEAIARQVSVLENTATLVMKGELEPDRQSSKLFQESLSELNILLAPYEAQAAALFAPPGAVEAEETPPEAASASFEEAAVLAPDSTPPLPLSTPAPKVAPVSDLDAELAEVFAMEAEEHIQNLDTRLAALESDPNNRELLREIRRTAHTLKGSAAMVGFQVISKTGHLMEDLLDRLYDGTIPVTEEVTELLFITFNSMDALVRGLAVGVPEDPAILDALRPNYAALLSGQEVEAESEGGAIIFERKAAPAEARPVPAIELHRVDEAVVEALEAAIAAAEADPDVAVDERETVKTFAVARPMVAATASASVDTDLSVKVPIKRLNTMMNQIGELVINRTMLEQRNQILNRTVDELALSIKRLQRVTRELETRYEVELLRNVAIPVEANPVSNGLGSFDTGNGRTALLDERPNSEFDALEMDRYTEFHTMSREMTETVDDLAAALRELDLLKGDLENAVIQQARLTDDLQDRVVKVRLVPVSNLTPRLYRTVRSIAAVQQKDIEFVVSGEQTQIDKTIFEELGDPLLHLVRNAIDHGIESPDEREAAGKSRTALLTFAARTEGSLVVIEVRDDGRGINIEKIKQAGIQRGLIAPDAPISNEEILDLIFVPGFSTSETVTDISGRGVGMDVVRSNIARLKGTVEIESEAGRGTAFIIRLPSTLAITRALLVRVGGYTYAIPLSAIERTVRTEPAAIEDYGQRSYYRLEDATLPLLDLGQLLQLHPHQRRAGDEEEEESARSQFAIRRERPLLIINGPERAAIRIDGLVGQQEVVVKPLGTHLKAVPGVTGATILGTGEVILILNAYELVAGATGRRNRYSTAPRPGQPALNIRHGSTEPLAPTPRKRTPLIQVVDDSLSVRKVLSAALEKAGFRVRTSKDGQEALEMVQQVPPDLMVMDIEMPRMDGYELTSILKSRETFRRIPIVMLTSRAGLKHRQKAEEVGADGFLIKPYREEELLQIVSALLVRSRV